MWEHTKDVVFVEKPVDYFTIARGIVENIPKAVFEVLKGHLKILGNRVLDRHGSHVIIRVRSIVLV